MNIKILQQNICKDNKQVKELMDALIIEEPQVFLFSEFGYSKHKKNIVVCKEKVKQKLMNFENFIQVELKASKQNHRSTLV